MIAKDPEVRPGSGGIFVIMKCRGEPSTARSGPRLSWTVEAKMTP